MEVTEERMTKEEIKKINSKNNKSLLFMFLGTSFLGFLLFMFNSVKPDSVELEGEGGGGLFIVNIIFGLLFIVFFYNLVKIFFSPNIKKDNKEEVKLNLHLIVKNKIKDISYDDDDDVESITYGILFEKNKYLEEYPVTSENYQNINIGDIVEVSLSKYSEYILSIYCNSIDIEKSNHIK